MRQLPTVILAVLAGVLLRPVVAPAPASADQAEIERLKQRLAALERREFGDPATQPPLDSPLVYRRGQDTDTPPGATRQILSLIHEVKAKQAFPWPLYIQLTSAHDRGDAVGATVRLTTTGDGWGSGFHAETFHDAGKGTTIGVNVEPHKKVADGRSIGMNIQAVDWAMDGTTPPITVVDEAINIQTAPKARFNDGLRFDVGSKGRRAIAIDGNWETGLDLGSAAVDFGGKDGIRLAWNPARNRIEFIDRKTGTVLKSIASQSNSTPRGGQSKEKTQ